MPVMNGFEATRNIRRIERELACAQASSDRSNNTYVVALTGLASQQDEEEALAAGVDRFVTKPVQFGQLTQLLKERIGRSSNVQAEPCEVGRQFYSNKVSFRAHRLLAVYASRSLGSLSLQRSEVRLAGPLSEHEQAQVLCTFRAK